MKKSIVVCLLACAAVFAESWLSLSVTEEIASKYTFQGAVVNPDPVSFTSVYAGAYGFYGIVYATTDLSDFNDPSSNNGYMNDRQYRFEEVDYIGGYEYTFETDFSPVTVGAFYEYCQYPHKRNNVVYDPETMKMVAVGHKTTPHDSEVDFYVNLDNVLPKDCPVSLKVGTTFSFDLENDCWFGNVCADAGYAVTEKMSVSVCATGYWRSGKSNEVNFIYGEKTQDFQFNVLEVKPKVSFSVTENVAVEGYVSYLRSIQKGSGAALEENSMNSRNNLVGGVSVTFSF